MTFSFRRILFNASPNPKVAVPVIKKPGPIKLSFLPVFGTEKVAVATGSVGETVAVGSGVIVDGSVGL